jgi:hypothetical protein
MKAMVEGLKDKSPVVVGLKTAVINKVITQRLQTSRKS